MGGCCCCFCSDEHHYYEVVDYERGGRGKFNTGDLIFFSGSGVQSNLIKLFTNSNLTHVGIIIKSEKINRSEDGYYIWHSPSEVLSSAPDIISGTPKSGPQLNDLRQVIKLSGGRAYVRKLVKLSKRYEKKVITLGNSISHGRKELRGDDDGGGGREQGYRTQLPRNQKKSKRSEAITKLDTYLTEDPYTTELMTFMKGEDGKLYETSKQQLLLSVYDGPFGENTQDTSSYFCSELVVETYKMMGLISKKTISSEFTPKDLSTQSETQLKILGDYTLARKEIEVHVTEDIV